MPGSVGHVGGVVVQRCWSGGGLGLGADGSLGMVGI